MGMAAANNEDLFVKFFDLPDTAVIQIPGRMFPVEIEHIPQKDRISQPLLPVIWFNANGGFNGSYGERNARAFRWLKRWVLFGKAGWPAGPWLTDHTHMQRICSFYMVKKAHPRNCNIDRCPKWRAGKYLKFLCQFLVSVVESMMCTYEYIYLYTDRYVPFWSFLLLNFGHIFSSSGRFQDEPLTIRTDIVKRGSQRKQFDCEPFLEVGNLCVALVGSWPWILGCPG